MAVTSGTQGKHVVSTASKLQYVVLAVGEACAYLAILRFRGFGGVRAWVRDTAVASGAPQRDLKIHVAVIERTLDCLPRNVRCLGRAAVFTRILRRHSVPAQMKIGVRVAPFFAHAWVVSDRQVFGFAEDLTQFTVIDQV
ncbi:MAG: lasso peptide biosynthesis B2 protein [Acidobacteriota bacterium]